jgi:hypothetical protein
MKRKYTSIILAVLIMATIVTFPLVGCKKATVITPTTSAETTTETTVETTTETTVAPTETTAAPTETTAAETTSS